MTFKNKDKFKINSSCISTSIDEKSVILNIENGKPIINLHGIAKKKLENVESSSISISNDGGFVISVVTFLD